MCRVACVVIRATHTLHDDDNFVAGICSLHVAVLCTTTLRFRLDTASTKSTMKWSPYTFHSASLSSSRTKAAAVAAAETARFECVLSLSLAVKLESITFFLPLDGVRFTYIAATALYARRAFRLCVGAQFVHTDTARVCESDIFFGKRLYDGRASSSSSCRRRRRRRGVCEQQNSLWCVCVYKKTDYVIQMNKLYVLRSVKPSQIAQANGG